MIDSDRQEDKTTRPLEFMLRQQFLGPAECRRLGEEADRLFDAYQNSGANLRLETWKESDVTRISKFDPICDLSPVFNGVAQSRKIHGLLYELTGEPHLLFKDKLIYKLPGHPGFGPHQDSTWYRGFPDEILAVVIAIDPATESSGQIQVARLNEPFKNPVPQTEVRDVRQSELPDEILWESVKMRPGDALVLSSSALHRSGPNCGSSPRRALFLSYAPARYGDLYERYYAYREDLLRRGVGSNVGNFDLSDEDKLIAQFRPPVRAPGRLADR